MIHRIVTGLFRPKKRKKLSFMTTMVCIEHDCGYMWDASCVSNPCPKCASHAVMPASDWDFENKGIYRLGKAGDNG